MRRLSWLNVKDLAPSYAVYSLFDRSGRMIYTGHTRNAARRLQDYVYRSNQKAPPALVAAAHYFEITRTNGKAAALDHEHRLTRSMRPRYNHNNKGPIRGPTTTKKRQKVGQFDIFRELNAILGF